MPKITPWRAGLLVWLGFFVLITTIGNAGPHGWLDMYALASQGARAEATVTSIEPQNHGRCDFRYTVNTVPYTGWGSGCSSAGVGGAITITYLPAEPDFATVHDAADEFHWAIISPFLISTIFGLICSVNLWERQRAQRTYVKSALASPGSARFQDRLRLIVHWNHLGVTAVLLLIAIFVFPFVTGIMLPAWLFGSCIVSCLAVLVYARIRLAFVICPHCAKPFNSMSRRFSRQRHCVHCGLPLSGHEK